MSDSTDATNDTTTTTADGDGARPARARRLRMVAAWLVLVLAATLTFGVAADVWVKRQLLDTTEWVRASDRVLAEPAVQSALADYIVNEIYSNVDVQAELADKLPGDWSGIAGTLAGALRAPATGGVEKLLGTPQVRKAWHDANEVAHRTLVNVLEDKMKYGSSSDGKVVLDLGSVVKAVATQLGLPKAIVDRIPPTAGQITLIQSKDLATAQKLVVLVKWMSLGLTVLILALYAFAVWLAAGARRRMLRNAGWSLVIVGIVLIIARRVTGNFVVGVISDKRYSAAGKVVYAIASEVLFRTAWVLIAYGLVIALGMILIGPSRIMLAVRRFVAPVFTLDALVYWGGSAVLFVLLMLWAPTPVFDTWSTTLLLAILVGLGLWELRRRALREFPDRRFDLDGVKDSVDSGWHSVSGRVRGLLGGDDDVAKLERLRELHASGALSDEEYASAKAKLLS